MVSEKVGFDLRLLLDSKRAKQRFIPCLTLIHRQCLFGNFIQNIPQETEHGDPQLAAA